MLDQEKMWLLKEKYNGEKTEGLFTDCIRLEHGEPLAYIIGNISFLDTTIFLDSHPLIPRAETEFWVKDAIEQIKDHRDPRVLDLCAGSGCIGVAVLNAVSDSHVTFAEIDPVHNHTIHKNILENSIESTRAEIVNGDLFNSVTGIFDFILSNPPYIDRELNRTDESVLQHEPHGALFGGHLGMDLITQIIRHAPTYLSHEGTLYIEHEPEQASLIATLAKEAQLHVITKKDQYGTLRYSVLGRIKT